MAVNNLIKLRRGSDWSSNPTLAEGEPGFDTSTNTLKIGDGSTAWNLLQPVNSGLVHPIIAAASSSDNSSNTFIQDLLLDDNGHVTGIAVGTASEGGGGGISNVVEDTTPQLGGNLDLNSKNLTGTGHIDIAGSGHFSSNITANSFIKDGGTSSQFLKADGSVDTSTYSTTDTQLTEEQVEDFVGAMLTGNTETGITVTYEDGDGTIDFVVASQTDENFTTADHSKLDGIEASADVTDTTNVTAAGALMDSELTDLAGVKGVTISTLQVKPSEGAFANGDKTKLDAIEASADVTDATNVNAAGAVMNSDSTTAGMSFVVDEDNMSSDSDTKVPTQQSVKAYVDATIVPALTTEQVQDIVGGMVDDTETGISVTYDDTNGNLEFVVDHDAANNFVANEHIDHTSVTLTAGDGLTGGGDISANRTFAVSVDDSTIEINSDALRIKDAAITPAKIGVGTFVFNEAGANYDFRVEGDTDANLLFLDASKDSILIGATTDGGVNSKLHVYEVANTNTTYSRTINVLGRGYSSTDGTYYHVGTEIRAEKYLSASTTDGGYAIGVNAAPVIYSPDGTNVLAEVTAFRCNPSINSAASNVTVTNAYDIKTVPHFAGTNNTVTNHYGLYLGDAGAGGTTPTNEYGVYQVNTAATNYFGGTLDVRGAAVFNEGGAAVDFRVEGDTDIDLLFVDGSEDTVQIGKLNINGAFTFPTADGSANQILKTDGNGAVSWAADGGGGGGGSMTTVKANGSQVGGADIVTLDFATDFTIGETPDTEINISIADGAITSAKMTTSTLVLNEAGAAVDFRVEGDTDTHLLFVDGSADKVGIGTDSPSYTLHVDGNIGLTNEGFYAASTGVILGVDGWIYNDGGISMSHGRFAADGDAQNTTYILRGATTNASFTTIQNNGANVVLASNRTMMFTANIVGRRTDQVNASNSDNAAYVLKGCLHNDGYGAALVGSVSKTVIAETDSSWDVQATVTGAGAGGADQINIQCKGANSKNVNWVAKLELLEVGGSVPNYTESNILNTFQNEIIP